ncbi:MAG: hypothetical protein KKE79_01440 [Actinobacteria bacterium]|nr:hypothetical protein [Actinomycetota bacterium]MBU4301243.1 hypothetical protein [Actinomycetota bacterium]MBU4385958.1 hypothetical protein [Actinomycetota bacterium]MBU4489277.1 hypothetical protein [Actinomycetota bacterium]MCG2795645.1 hypothetical protein [Actinomycetes bacterium]
MPESWPSEQARERFVRFLELELRVVKGASGGDLDPSLLGEFNDLLASSFPRTTAFIEKRLAGDVASGLSDETRMVAWAEARSVAGGAGKARVTGAWTEREIAEDINDCFREARARLGL